ncbi:hypothetical protein C8R43DRAFT_1229320 [Mycena crocata]|nr:hypothetical protein C8R43DRAFT_1229320 [Mycena crocata]
MPSHENTAAIQHDNIPDEIWEEIFCQLPRDVLMEVGLVNWRFHRLCRPLVFREFQLERPILPDAESSTQQWEDLFLLRLQFWTSAEIAPLVHTCRLEGWDCHPKRRPPLTAFFVALPCFVNVRRVVLSFSKYNQIFVQNTRLLPKLARLDIRFASAFEGEEIDSDGLPPQDVSEFSLLCSVPRIVTASQDWVPFLRRDKLLVMELDGGEQIYTEILAGASFPCTKRLTISLDELKPSLNLQILSKFPAVEALEVWLGYPDPTFTLRGPVGAMADIMPLLTELNAPEELLPWFLPIPTLHRLILPWQKAAERVLTLQPFKPLESITDLSFTVSDLDYEILRNICAVFPNLTALRVTVINIITLWDDEVYDGPYLWEVVSFFTALTTHSPFPRNLRKLAFRWEIQRGPKRTECSPPDLHQMKEFLVSEHAALKALWLDGPGLFYYWSASGGEVGLQYDDDDARGKEGYWDEVDSLRPQVGLFWDQI